MLAASLKKSELRLGDGCESQGKEALEEIQEDVETEAPETSRGGRSEVSVVF